MGEGLGLGLCARGSGEGGLSFAGGCSVGEEIDFFCYGAAEVVEGFADVGGIVISFI